MPPTMSILIELADLGSVDGCDQSRAGPADRGGAAESWWKRQTAGNFGIRRLAAMVIVVSYVRSSPLSRRQPGSDDAGWNQHLGDQRRRSRVLW